MVDHDKTSREKNLHTLAITKRARSRATLNGRKTRNQALAKLVKINDPVNHGDTTLHRLPSWGIARHGRSSSLRSADALPACFPYP